ncbi:SIR2 family NAD-dependent protein deacylase [Ureibacillus acetophenoni]|uniref:protein acetyllysine N-acetyltransferase n=1 Tax=Ureibacillus acetophenoni TaxID=614649 RepID=A0A285U695_9BACL|nr:NAD-dependent deacylase [Ureibacillus acetophenoni]SOC37352.1 NAD-dependent deacetylase [Ureibacillus acetophenoni]
MNQQDQIKQLAEWISNSSSTIVLTGAGMSTESGIPDFRSRSGWWNKIDPRTVATVDALENYYDLFHEFYSYRIKSLEKYSPHEGHEILAGWESKGLLDCVATQNVDGFHQIAGNKKVYELHGTITTVRCHSCNRPSQLNDFLNKENCKHCKGKLRPNVVLFGENLPEKSWMSSLNHIRNADLTIVIGTSLEVYPVNQLPTMTSGKKVFINLDISGPTKFDLTIKGKAKETLQLVHSVLNQ